MPIYKSQFGSGFMPSEEAFTALAKGFGSRSDPENFNARQQKRNDLAGYIRPDGSISPEAPRPVARKLQEMIDAGQIWRNPNNLSDLIVSDVSPGEGFEQLTGQGFGVPPSAEQVDSLSKNMDFYPAGMNMQQQSSDPISEAVRSALMGIPGQQQGSQQQPAPQQQIQQRYPMPGPGIEELMQQAMGTSGNIQLQNFLQQQSQAMAPQGFQQNGPMKPNPQMMGMLGYEEGGDIDRSDNPLAQLMGMIKKDRDAVPIVAHDGEYVLSKEAVDMMGEKNLDYLNELGKQFQGAPSKKLGGGVDDDEKDTRYSGGGRSSAMANSKRVKDSEEEKQKRIDEMRHRTTNNKRTSDALRPREGDQGFFQSVMSGISQAVEEMLSDPNMSTVDKEKVQQDAQIIKEAVEGKAKDISNFAQETNKSRDEAFSQQNKGWEGTGQVNPGRPMSGGATRSFQQDIPNKDYHDYTIPPKQSPPPTPPNKGGIPEDTDRQQSSPGEGVQDVNKQQGVETPEVHQRLSGAEPTVDWDRISQMDPAQAMSYMSQLAGSVGNTQGVQVGKGAGTKSEYQRRFQDLMGQYSAMKGLEDKVNAMKWDKLKRKENADKLKYEVDRLEAMSPYFGDLAKAEVDYKDAQARSLTAQAAAAEESASNAIGAVLDPSKYITMLDKVDSIKSSTIEKLRRATDSSFDLAKNKDKTPMWKDFYKKKLLYDFVSGSLSTDAGYEDVEMGEGPKGKLLSKDKSYKHTVSPEEFETIRKRAVEMKDKFDRLDALAGGGMSAFANMGESFFGAAQDSGINFQ